MRNPPSTKVMDVFSGAAAGDAARRRAYLDAACGDDAGLRAEVESLLAAQERAGEFLGAPAVEGLEEDQDAASCHDAVTVERGRAARARYAILERIGEGGFGVVYRARQDHPVRREVALKVVKLGMDTRQIIARFESERQALALMDHPGIARIFDAGATADGRPYFAMELVRGDPVTTHCDAGRLGLPQRLGLFVAICEAVQHAHQKGIIHRDLKPTNVLVALVDGRPVPKVIDFGVAKAMAAPQEAHTTLADARQFVGTPQYASPEQSAGGSGNVDTRSDIYSLGVLLYELLAGATPFGADPPGTGAAGGPTHAGESEDPPRPSARLGAAGPALAEAAMRRGLEGPRLRRALAGELDWIVARAMEREPARRYETAAALADDVRRYLAHEPLRAGPPDLAYRVRKFARRYRRPLLAAAAVALALLTGLAGTTFGLVRANRHRARAEAAMAEADQVSAFLADMLHSADPDRSTGNPVLVRDVLDRTTRSVDAGALKEHSLVEARIRMTLAGAYESLGLFPESESQVRAALDVRRRVLGPEHRQTLQCSAALAGATAYRGDYRGAVAEARRVLAAQERTLGPDHPDVIDTLVKLGHALRALDLSEEAEATLGRAADLSRRAAPDPDVKARAITALAVARMDRENYDGAEPLLHEALALDRAAHGDKFRNVPRNLSNLAAIRAARGDLAGAEAYWVEALRLQREILPPDHQDTAWTLRLLGRVKWMRGDAAAAEARLREALRMERQVFRPGHPVLARFLQDLADVLADRGERSQAAAARREAVDTLLGNETDALAAAPNDAAHRGAAGELRLRRGDWAGARADVDAAARLAPRQPRWQLLGAALRCHAGDDAEYLAFRREILRRGDEFAGAGAAGDAALACVLAPAAGEELPGIVELSGRAAAPGSSGAARAGLCQGLVALRAGQLARSADLLGLERAAATGAAPRAAAGFFLAVAYHRLGQMADAAAALDDAEAEYRRVATVEDGDTGPDCVEWLVCQIARREARAAATPGLPPG